MDGLIIAAIILVVFIFLGLGILVYKSIKQMKSNSENKKLFLSNSAKIKKGQTLDEVLELLGRPTSYSEIDGKYTMQWEQTEETEFETITRMITIVVNKKEIVIDVYRDNIQ